MHQKFLSGPAMPLAIPQCARREWQKNGVVGARLQEYERHHSDEVGFEFEWGQIVQRTFDANDVDLGSKIGKCVEWDFRLNQLHTEFLNQGGHLEELSDLSVYLLEKRIDNTIHNGWPKCIILDDGDDLASFGLTAFGPNNVGRARRWIANSLIPIWIPALFVTLRGALSRKNTACGLARL